MTLRERLDLHSMPEPNTGCRLWLGGLQNGYGNIKIEGKTQLVHRMAYELKHGPIPDGRQIDHKCRIRSCIEDKHLEPVTQAENRQRGLQGIMRTPKTHCINGHAYVGNNIYQDRKGVIRCMECARINWMRSWYRQKEETNV